MPNLKEEILDLLKAFPPAITEGKTFEELLADLAEDIQAAMIRAMRGYGDAYAPVEAPHGANSNLWPAFENLTEEQKVATQNHISHLLMCYVRKSR